MLSPVSSCFIFVFALSKFSGPDYLGAWNRLILRLSKGVVSGRFIGHFVFILSSISREKQS